MKALLLWLRKLFAALRDDEKQYVITLPNALCAYDGPACYLAKVPVGKIYADKAEAQEHADALNAVLGRVIFEVRQV